MTDMKHTPTPWHTENSPGDWGLPGSVSVFGDGKEVCSTEYTTPYCVGASRSDIAGYDRAQADAALIVRAVNAHDALVEALQAVNDWLQGLEDGAEEGDPLKAIRERAHAPIRKTIGAALTLAEKERP